MVGKYVTVSSASAVCVAHCTHAVWPTHLSEWSTHHQTLDGGASTTEITSLLRSGSVSFATFYYIFLYQFSRSAPVGSKIIAYRNTKKKRSVYCCALHSVCYIVRVVPISLLPLLGRVAKRAIVMGANC